MPNLNVTAKKSGGQEKKPQAVNKTLFEEGKKALDKEAIRVVQSMPKWTPGKDKGKNVNTVYYLPINFKLQ